MLKTQIFQSSNNKSSANKRNKSESDDDNNNSNNNNLNENNIKNLNTKKKRKILESRDKNLKHKLSFPNLNNFNNNSDIYNHHIQNHNIYTFKAYENIQKKIDFSTFNRNNNFGKNSSLLFSENMKIEDLEFSSENSKPSFKKLINFDIEDKEATSNFLEQKKIPKSPYKVLDAPNLKDDFYLHLLDWSAKDLLAVGLDKSLYIWEGKNSNVNLINTLDVDQYTSVGFSGHDQKLLVGTSSGKINIWDLEKQEIIQSFHSHTERVGVIAKMNSNFNIFSSGSQDKHIFHYDLRLKEAFSQSIGHSQEVCGLKWSLDDRRLASGGNDNKLILWNFNKFSSNTLKNDNYNNLNLFNTYEKKFKHHKSAVKAIDWSPHKFGFLISGGGTQDRTIKVWNTNLMTLTESLDTGSQVCNIKFSRLSKEFVTTHGYSDNLILVWDSERMDVKATLKGHKDRVIYLSLGPDNQKIVTGAGDETIRFWDVFIPENLNSTNGNTNNNKDRSTELHIDSDKSLSLR